MRRLLTVEEVKRAVINIDKDCSQKEMENVGKEMSHIFFAQSPYKIDYLQDQ